MKAQPLTVYLPDTRGVELSRYGIGNLKLGIGVFTYSRLPGRPNRLALGSPIGEPVKYAQPHHPNDGVGGAWSGTCPGSTPECESICYAARPVEENGPVAKMWLANSLTDFVPPIPPEAKLLRLHVSGDFTSVQYIENWIARLQERPDVVCWGYTRSWRVPGLLAALERLRALPNVQLFGSMDPSCQEQPPADWRRSWIWRETPKSAAKPAEVRLRWLRKDEVKVYEGKSVSTAYHGANQICTVDQVPSFVCPEETGAKKNCVECGYCFEGQKNDVTFLEH